MSRDGYLPNGVEYSDIPGNRPTDLEWEGFHDWIDAFFDGHHPEDAQRIIMACSDASEEANFALDAFDAIEGPCICGTPQFGDCPYCSSSARARRAIEALGKRAKTAENQLALAKSEAEVELDAALAALKGDSDE